MRVFSSKKILIGIICAFFLTTVYLSLQINDINPLSYLYRLYISLPNLIANKPTCANCNIILISIDTLGANHLPCYGYNRNTSPNLCKFGQENILVQDMSANSSYTLASHASLFTGLYPNKHGVNIPNVDWLNKKIPFLPEELKKNGYETYFCMTSTDPHLPIDKVYNRGIDKIYETYKLEDWDVCLKKLESNNKKNKKTFIFLHTYRVHSPYLASPQQIKDAKLNTQTIPSIPEVMEEYISMKYEEGFFHFFIQKLEEDLTNKFWGENSTAADHYKNMHVRVKQMKTKSEMLNFLNDEKNEYIINEYLGAYYSYKSSLLSKNQISRLSDIYDLAIMETDSYLGKIFHALYNTKEWTNTVIAITSDHGEEFMEHGNVVGHGANLYSTTTRVPLIMRVPGTKKRNVTVPAESIDIFPTLLGIVGIKNTLRLPGSDIFGIKSGVLKADLLYNDYHERTVRDNDWRLIIRKEGSVYSARELYNVSTDVNEMNNRIFEKRTIINNLLKIFREGELTN